MEDVGGNALMCIKRDTSFNYLDLTKPTLDETQGSEGRYVCDENTKLCLSDPSGADVGGVNPD